MSEPVMPFPRTIVVLSFADGTERKVEATGPLQMGPTFVMIPTERGGHVGVPMDRLQIWETVVSPLTIARGN